MDESQIVNEKYKIISQEELQSSSLSPEFKKRVDKLLSRISGQESITGASCFEQVAHALLASADTYQDSNVMFLSYASVINPPHHVVLTDRSNTRILLDPPETFNYEQGDELKGYYLSVETLRELASAQ